MTEGRRMGALALALVLALAGVSARAQSLSGPALARALQGGGYVLVMRHAASPAQPPAPAEADEANVKGERQLDAAGQAAAKAMGEAMRRLRLPIGEVWSSPTYRALQTVRLADLHGVRAAPELDEASGGMQAAAVASSAAWLKARAARPPRAGSDAVVVTHLPNVTAAFGPSAAGLQPGEALVFRPDGKGGSSLVARIRAEDWPALAVAAP